MKQLSTTDVGIDEVPTYFNIEYYFTKGIHNNITQVEQVHCWTSYLLVILVLMKKFSTTDFGVDIAISIADIEIDEVTVYCRYKY